VGSRGGTRLGLRGYVGPGAVLLVWLEVGTRRLLFDTGQSALLARNASRLETALDTVDTIVLSHGHYDHGGGLAAVLAQARTEVAVYAHPGVVNTLDWVLELVGDARLLALVGGMHLRSATPARLAWTVQALRRSRIAKLYLAHCTGAAATAALWTAFPGQCLASDVGTVISLT
jgi:metal-dependent hydrolase (beta-lactamase superfamily II)